MLRGFVVIVVGGLGDLRGAVIAGLALGIIEVLTAAYLSSGPQGGRRPSSSSSPSCGPGPAGLFGRAVIRRA